MHFQTIIFGGGPAGCAAAIRLAAFGHSVLVVEHALRVDSKIGETLPPATSPMLAQLGAWERFLATGPIPSPGIVSFWASSEGHENDFVLNPFGCGWHIDRERFDAMLINLAKDLGTETCYAKRLLRLDRRGRSWTVILDSDDGAREVDCRLIADATGRNALLARHLSIPKRRHDRLVGIVRRGRSCNPDSRLVIESTNGGWWYASRLPDSGVVAAFMTDADLLDCSRSGRMDRWNERLAQAPGVSAWLHGAELDPRTFVYAADTYRHTEIAGEDWLLMGDAAIGMDPLSGTGILNALRSGSEAGDAAHRALAGPSDSLRAYASRVLERFENDLLRRCAFYSEERRWPDHEFWQRRQRGRVPY